MAKSVHEICWEIRENYEERQKLRWQEYHNAKGAAIRSNLLNDIGYEEREYIKTMQSIGAIPKVPDKLKVEDDVWKTLAELAAEEDEEADKYVPFGGGATMDGNGGSGSKENT